MESNITSHPGVTQIRNALTRIVNVAAAGDQPEYLEILKQRHAGKLHQLKRAIQGAQKGITRDFIVPPECCDCTQPEDLGYGTPEHEADIRQWEIENKQLRHRPKREHGRLSSTRDLCVRVMGKNFLYNKISNPFGIVPEFNRKGGRRCTYCSHDGFRCLNYSNNLVCEYHMEIVQHSPHLNDKFIGSIKSIPLKQAYERHLKDPAKRAIDSEIALMRTMLDALLCKMDDIESVKDMPMAQIAGVMKMCEMITHCVERMANIEAKLQMRVSVEDLNRFTNNLLQFMVETCTPSKEQMVKLLNKVEKSPLFQVANPDSIVEAEFYGNEEASAKEVRPNDDLRETGEINKEALSQEEFTAKQRSKCAYLNNKHGGTQQAEEQSNE